MIRNKRIHFLISQEEETRIKEKMKQIGITNRNAYLRKMALDGYCIHLDLGDLKSLLRLMKICSNNLNQYAKRANESENIYKADIADLQKRFDEIFSIMKEILVKLSKLN